MDMNIRWGRIVVTALVAGLAGCVTGPQNTVSYSGYSGPVIVSANRQVITVGGFFPPCFTTVRPVARETNRSVALWLRYVTPVNHGACSVSVGMVRAINVSLRAPLGDRALVDGATGRPLSWFDARRILHPAWLPAGFKLVWIGPGAPFQPRVLGCYERYESATGTFTGTLDIIERVGQQAGSSGETPIRVNGHPGFAASDWISWEEDGITFTITAATRHVLTTRQLIKIAR
jgi:hypothetical protein